MGSVLVARRPETSGCSCRRGGALREILKTRAELVPIPAFHGRRAHPPRRSSRIRLRRRSTTATLATVQTTVNPSFTPGAARPRSADVDPEEDHIDRDHQSDQRPRAYASLSQRLVGGPEVSSAPGDLDLQALDLS